MDSKTTERFRKSFDKLPDKVKKEAKSIFKIWKSNPYQENLKFKRIHSSKDIYSVRIGLGWRALAIKEGNTMVWFWIGSHSDYDNLLRNL